MQNCSNSSKKTCVNSKNKTPTKETKATTVSSRSEISQHQSHLKCSKPPTTAEISQAANAKTKCSLSASSTGCKKPTASNTIVNKSASRQSLNSSPIPGASSKGEDLTHLAVKFGELSSSILQLATSQQPVGVRSLESLLSKELSNSLGDVINSPAFSQEFVEVTRVLLGNLVSAQERGKLNSNLLKDKTKEDKSFIRANSSTTVCYRDRYFKELIMNVLQSMTSCEMEEEVSPLAACSEESRERIRVIRDMVRTEAGLEPDDFRELEQQLDELKKSVMRNRLEVERATKEVERIISQHLVQEESSVDCLEMPPAAREVLKSCCIKNSPMRSGFDKNVGLSSICEKGSGCSKETQCTGQTNAFNGRDKYVESLKILGKENCFEKGNSDATENIRPHLKKLVHEELIRIKMKEGVILNRDRQFDRSNGLEDTPKSSLDSIEFKSAASNVSADDDEDYDDDDEISEHETRIFLEALKADNEERKKTDEITLTNQNSFCTRVLERIDEDEIGENITISPSNSRTSSSVMSTVNTTKDLKSECGTVLSAVNLQDNGVTNLRDKTEYNISKTEELLQEEKIIERIKSKWWNREENDVINVLAEMKGAFEIFKVMSDNIFNTSKVSEDFKKETGDGNEKTNMNNGKDFYLSDFTVQEVQDVLVNLSNKVKNLPQYLQEIALNISPTQKEQAFTILSVLGKCMNASYPTDPDVTVILDDNSISLPIKNVAKTFSLLSQTLSWSPKEIKSEPISVLNPPKSLLETLTALSSTTYFRECFTHVKENTNKQDDPTKNFEIIKPYNINEQRSSAEIFICDQQNTTFLANKSRKDRKKIHTFMRDKKRPDDLNKNLTNFEHFLGLTASVMTVHDVSNMFLFLSTVFNDVPARLKSEKILDLNPPSSLLKALDILYSEDNSNSTNRLEKKSFSSLTVQNVSDFLLTLSKTFDDVPERLKDSLVLDLQPPKSLLRAITLLTNLSHFSIPKCYSQEVEENTQHESINIEQQEKFFDAVDSLTSLC